MGNRITVLTDDHTVRASSPALADLSAAVLVRLYACAMSIILVIHRLPPLELFARRGGGGLQFSASGCGTDEVASSQ